MGEWGGTRGSRKGGLFANYQRNGDGNRGRYWPGGGRGGVRRNRIVSEWALDVRVARIGGKRGLRGSPIQGLWSGKELVTIRARVGHFPSFFARAARDQRRFLWL